MYLIWHEFTLTCGTIVPDWIPFICFFWSVWYSECRFCWLQCVSVWTLIGRSSAQRPPEGSFSGPPHSTAAPVTHHLLPLASLLLISVCECRRTTEASKSNANAPHSFLSASGSTSAIYTRLLNILFQTFFV